MPLLLLFAGAGVQAPAPPATGPICGVVSVQLFPTGVVSRTRAVGVVDGPFLDAVIKMNVVPNGAVAQAPKPVGIVSPIPVGTVAQTTRPAGEVQTTARPTGDVSACED